MRAVDAVDVAPDQATGAGAATAANEQTVVQTTESGADRGEASSAGLRAWSRFGGLLYLLNVVDELGLAAAIEDDETLAARPFRWSLHQLALRLAPVELDDPAALAFAGLGPDAEPPSLDEEPPTELELAHVDVLAERIAARLRERLDRPDDPTALLLDGVCRRRAEIVADPGWIEARFSIDDTDVDLRRAALDLDPGWLPWLGAVVAFVYA
jgi:hypothetical protein